MVGLTERGEMEKTGNSCYSFGDWASQNQHVDIREKTGSRGNKTCPFGDCISCHQPHVENIWKFDTKYSDMPLGAVLDTGAQRGATGTSTEILSRTGTTLNMQPAAGTVKKMTDNLMGAETINQHGKSFILVVLDVSVYDPGMSDSLISAGRLLEAGYNVKFRISDDALTDGFALATFPLYSGSITTPDNLTVNVMQYAGHTWRLPKVRAISKSVP